MAQSRRVVDIRVIWLSARRQSVAVSCIHVFEINERESSAKNMLADMVAYVEKFVKEKSGIQNVGKTIGMVSLAHD